jgi:hypothetical protein
MSDLNPAHEGQRITARRAPRLHFAGRGQLSHDFGTHGLLEDHHIRLAAVNNGGQWFLVPPSRML